MTTQIKTLKLRVRDKHAKALRRLAFGVNQVWNIANELTSIEYADYKEVPIPGVGMVDMSSWISAYDVQKRTLPAIKARSLGVPANTSQEVISKHGQARKQFKKCKLRWRSSGGSRRNLGWVPFKKGDLKYRSGQVRFMKEHIGLWDSWGLSKFEFRAGSFSEDSRGRWYLNIAVEVPVERSTGAGQVGIDLGLKTTAKSLDGFDFERHEFFRKSEKKLAMAQRANKKKLVRTIHAKIKNQRLDASHKYTTEVVRRNSLIVVGNVSSSKLAKTNMAKSVLDAGWYQLKQQLEYKSKAMQVVYLEVNEAYSTQTCSSCLTIPDSSPKGLTGLNKRNWTCSNCGMSHDRDLNSCANILRLGHQAL